MILRLGSGILQLVVLLVTVKAGSPVGFPRRAMETGSRPLAAAAVSFEARSSPVFDRFAIADFEIVAADPFSFAGFDLVAAVGPVDLVAGSAVVVDFAAAVVAVYSAVAGFACSVCFFGAETGKGRAVVGISYFLNPQSSF